MVSTGLPIPSLNSWNKGESQLKKPIEGKRFRESSFPAAMLKVLFLESAAISWLTVAIFCCFALFTGTLRGENIEQTVIDFVMSSFSRKAEAVRNLSSQEKAALIRQIRKSLGNQSPDNQKYYFHALAFLGEEDGIRDVVGRFVDRTGAGPESLALVQDPRIIELLAPYFLRSDPERLTGGDALVLPISFDAAEAAVLLLCDAPAFTHEVNSWARSLKGRTHTEQRQFLQSWWRINEGLFRVKRYELVRPGLPPPRDPMAHLHASPENTDAALDTHTAETHPTPEHTESESPTEQARATLPNAMRSEETSSRSVSSGVLWASAAALLALAGGLLFYRKRSTH